MHWWDDHMGGWGFGGWLMMIMAMVAFWGVIAWTVVTIARASRSPREQTSPTAEEILAQRFARGDIDEHEYSARLATLRRGPTLTSSVR